MALVKGFRGFIQSFLPIPKQKSFADQFNKIGGQNAVLRRDSKLGVKVVKDNLFTRIERYFRPSLYNEEYLIYQVINEKGIKKSIGFKSFREKVSLVAKSNDFYKKINNIIFEKHGPLSI